MISLPEEEKPSEPHHNQQQELASASAVRGEQEETLQTSKNDN